MLKLRCTHRECESHKNDQHLFETRVTVDEDAELAENLKRADASEFTCSFCGSEAKLVDLDVLGLSPWSEDVPTNFISNPEMGSEGVDDGSS